MASYTSIIDSIRESATKCFVCEEKAVLVKNKLICAVCEYRNHLVTKTGPFVPTSTRVKTEAELAKEAEDEADGFKPVPCAGTCGELVRGTWDYCSACVKSIIAPWNTDLTNVIGRVYISNAKNASDLTKLQKHNIARVVTIGTKESVPITEHPGVEYHRFDMEDHHQANIRSVFEPAFWLTKLPGNTLIHCKAGVSRSATVVIAYLMTFGASYRLAYNYLYSIRQILRVNIGFHEALSKYDEELRLEKQKRNELYIKLGMKIPTNAEIDLLTEAYIENH